MQSIIRSDGYFTWLKFLLDKSASELENKVGYSPDALAAGWKLLSPRFPIAPHNIDLRGSSRWSEGILPDGRNIGSVLSARLSLSDAQKKLATFFDQGLDRRPAKIRPNSKPAAYPAAKPVGIPQFKLAAEIDWVVLADVAPGKILRRADIRI
ncbi:MAG: hypothetical protein JSS22_11620 [Proteobacteria bacterium]|nr:hypothetical protein [Pseudomonadota bacterium]